MWAKDAFWGLLNSLRGRSDRSDWMDLPLHRHGLAVFSPLPIWFLELLFSKADLGEMKITSMQRLTSRPRAVSCTDNHVGQTMGLNYLCCTHCAPNGWMLRTLEKCLESGCWRFLGTRAPNKPKNKNINKKKHINVSRSAITQFKLPPVTAPAPVYFINPPMAARSLHSLTSQALE